MNRYFLQFGHCSREQLERFERAAVRLMRRDPQGWGDAWLLAANELTFKEQYQC
ncbi:hypothetical protein [Buttiauxella sp. A111]|uniref:hypothetical protein n=1 Tax=Buttiauxella sp. A111 TaxID=2563088 RepID=UPI0010D730BE|nr:hypothetical protein [Buttiauxella sp. A111]GDX06332.1 hypothetical protein BSPA111_25410 [Buttiauxella sp. A111]